MPSSFPPTFASAAASTNGDSSASRRDNASAGDWSRSRVNGATQTFRRPSQAATTSQTQSRDTAPVLPSNAGGVYVPPHLNTNHPAGASRNLTTGDTRYSKDQLLDIFQQMIQSAALDAQLEEIFQGTWDPLDGSLGPNGRAALGDGKDQTPGPEVCWNYDAGSEPFGLTRMTEDEKQFFSTSVNSPIKPQQTASAKDATGVGVAGGRKASVSGYGGPTSGSRPSTRRRETSDSFMSNGPLSPSESKTFFRGDSNTATPPPALLRRRTDYKDEDSAAAAAKDEFEADESQEAQSQYPGSLRRSATGPVSAGLNPPSASPWSSGGQGSGFGVMGTFGSFAIGSSAPQPENTEKRPGFGSARGSSRFKDLLTKASNEDIQSPVAKDKNAFGPLEKLPEEITDPSQSRLREDLRNRPGRSETNPYDEPPMRSGSAALGGSQEDLPTQGIEQMGFNSFGPPSNIGTKDFGQDDPYQQAPYGRLTGHEPMSPTNTNPYQSPPARIEEDDHETADSTSQASGLPPFGGSRRNMFPGPEGQPGVMRNTGGFGAFGGLPGLPGAPTWSAPALGPGKTASAFGDPIFSPLTDIQSPGTGGLGGGFFGSAGFGSAGRASRLGAMFPPAMQEQMRGDSRNELQPGHFDSRPDSAQQHAVRDPFDGRRQEVFNRGSGMFEETPSMRSAEESAHGQAGGQFGPSTSSAPTNSLPTPQTAGPRTGSDNFQAGHGLSQSSGSNSSNQMPAAQQRQMVMPDRMRWIYRDPQGNTQGPWSGLEMHDWFKAGFFTAELQVKKLEDSEYEPLAQLVRRIGNSREPFLVPQIGVPHGPPSSGQGNHWASPSMGGSGAAQPPFASSFPSFGTTLTADQQNALERRKQEEQFLMARQKEHLAQQQIAMKHMQISNGMHSLQHHSSAHSLQSQPSFGSITSPPGPYQQSPMQGPIQPPQHAPPFAQQAPTTAPQYGRDDDPTHMMSQMSFNQRVNFGAAGPLGPSAPDHGPSPSAVSAMLQDRARLQQQQQQQQQTEVRGHQDTFLGHQGRNERLEEFHELRGQADLQTGRPGPEAFPQPIGAKRNSDDRPSSASATKPSEPVVQTPPAPTISADSEVLSLAQQVQIAAASKAAADEEKAWAKKDDTPIEPPPASISPLPAPAAQRNRQHVADALAAESRSATQTPIDTPSASVAPWAERSIEHAKGPSLKEIQEAEAKRAAEQEALAAAARARQAEEDRQAQAAAPPPAPGLPSTATWGTSSSPVTPTIPNASVWASKANNKAGSASAGAKKTLAQIQKEEENRKQRAAAAAAAAAAASLPTAGSPASAAVGKRYAELASKAAPALPASTNAAWTTVGSGGKAKTPAAVIATPQPTRSVSSNSTAANAKARPALPTARSTAPSNQSKANEEFTKWTKGALSKGLNSNINLDSFVQDLLMLPPEIEIISDSVYASSETLDGRRFAEEFVRRRKLADKGIVEPASNVPAVAQESKGTGGWSEVAKKGPAPKEEPTNTQFKVVATKKKGKR